MEPTFWKAFTEYGILGLVLGVMFFILWRMIIWVMGFVKTQTEQHNKERECWQRHSTEQSSVLQSIRESIARHDERAEERGKYVREEHKQMIEALGRINGYKGGHHD